MADTSKTGRGVSYPTSVWLFFYPDEEHGTTRGYRAVYATDSLTVRERIEEADEQGYAVMEVRVDEVTIYSGDLDADKVMEKLEERFLESLTPLVRCDAYVLTDDFMERVIRYLEAAKTLVSEDSSMEDIIKARDRSYGEDEEIQRVIATIRSIRQL